MKSLWEFEEKSGSQIVGESGSQEACLPIGRSDSRGDREKGCLFADRYAGAYSDVEF